MFVGVLTFCCVQQRHHEAVDSQLQQQILDHLQQIIRDLHRRQSVMTTPGWQTPEENVDQREREGREGSVAEFLCVNISKLHES